MVRAKETFAETETAAIVQAQHYIPVIDEVLNPAFVAFRHSPAGPAMHPNERGCSPGFARSPEQTRNLETVERTEAYDFRLNQILRIDLRRQTPSELSNRLLVEIINMNVTGRSISFSIKREVTSAPGKNRRGDALLRVAGKSRN